MTAHRGEPLTAPIDAVVIVLLARAREKDVWWCALEQD
jgi:hypothetical protein